MSSLVVVKEKRRATLTVRFLNEHGQLQMPATVQYRIDCLSSGAQVRDWTDVTPGPTVQIPIPSEDNRILAGLDRELRRVTVVASYGDGELVPDEYDYVVKNLRYLN